MKHRSFLAFDITDEMRGELSSITSLLAGTVDGVRWVKPELLHCTLRFFGDVEEDLLQGDLARVIEQEVKHQSPIHLTGNGIGVFPNWRYPRVIWGGLSGETEAMLSLHAKLESAFEDFGFERDQRSLRLHLTLGRAKSPLKHSDALMQIVEKLADKNFGELAISALTLYESVLTKGGSIYTPLKLFKFGGK